MVRHRQRSTWEVPGGHREDQEDSQKAAERELYEETGAEEFKVFPVSAYSVKNSGIVTFGKLFYAEIKTLGNLPNFEIAEIKLADDILKETLTYPAIQPVLIQKLKLI
ncbi:MAG: NUDIX hydrolase [Bacteroidota bacterium]